MGVSRLRAQGRLFSWAWKVVHLRLVGQPDGVHGVYGFQTRKVMDLIRHVASYRSP